MSAPIGPYSPFVQRGGWTAISGQIGLREGVMQDGFDAQLAQVLENLGLRLGEAGLQPSDVLKTTVFLTDLGDFGSLNERYVAFFGDHRPARSTVQVAGLPMGAVVEIEAWAFAG